MRTTTRPATTATEDSAAADSPNILDSAALSKIIQVRDTLIAMQNRGERVYRLESGTPAYDLFPEVAEAIIKAVRENKTFYTEASGILPLRETICAKLARKNGVTHDLSPKTVFVGQGGMGTLYCIMKSLAGSADTIITPSPVWISITNIARLTGARIVEVPLREELGFNWDMDEFAAAVAKEKPAFVIIVNPGNPTGGISPRADVEPLFELVRRHGFFVVEDLAYEDIVYDDNYTILTREAHLTGDPDVYRRFIPVFSMSKSQNYSGMRIGYTHIAEPKIIERFRKSLLYTTNGVNSIAQWGAIEALHARHDARLAAMVAGYKERGDALYDGLERAGVFHLPGPPQGAFYLFPHIMREKLPTNLKSKIPLPAADDPLPLGEWMSGLFLEHGIGSIAGHHFGASAAEHIRLSYTCSVEDCRAVAGKLVDLFAR